MRPDLFIVFVRYAIKHIHNRKPLSESGAAYVIHFVFCLFFGQHVTKN